MSAIEEEFRRLQDDKKQKDVPARGAANSAASEQTDTQDTTTKSEESHNRLPQMWVLRNAPPPTNLPRDFWAQQPSSTLQPTPLSVPKAKEVEVPVPKAKGSEVPPKEPEPFPQLARSAPIACGTGKDFWTGFSKKKSLRCGCGLLKQCRDMRRRKNGNLTMDSRRGSSQGHWWLVFVTSGMK
jgi:hypothetical protein